MALPMREQAKYWASRRRCFWCCCGFWAMCCCRFWWGGAIAYFLDPVADRLQRAGLSRTAATTVISLVALLAVILLVLAIIPTLVNQLTALVNAAPEIAHRLQAFLLEKFPELADSTSAIRQTLANIGRRSSPRACSWPMGCSPRPWG